MGKSASGAVWLTADRTSPYAFHQYWINIPDQDIGSFLRLFSTLGRDEIAGALEAQRHAPQERSAQRLLAGHMTERLHGTSERHRVEAASEALFGRGSLRDLDAATIEEIAKELPHSEHPRDRLGEGMGLVEFLPETTLATSRREARELLAAGAIVVNGDRIGAGHRLSTADLLPGAWVMIRRGKRQWHATRWT
jgi:tyrosyl-tRNA synthetase